MPAKKSKSMRTRERVIPDKKSMESPPPQTTSIGRVVRKTLKAREEDKDDDDIEPPKRLTKKQPKTLEKIRSEFLTKESSGFSRIRDWMQALSPPVSFLLLAHY